MNVPGNRGSIQLSQRSKNRQSANLERNSLLHTSLDDHEAVQMVDLSALFTAPPTRWEESESLCDYFGLLYVDFREYLEEFDWQEAREKTLYFLEKFTLRITFDDVMLLFTLYTLFGSQIEVLTHTESHDQVYENMYTISFTLFCIELIANSFARTTVKSWCPFIWEGYLFSFFWWLDLVAIVSLFPSMKWVAKPIGLDQSLDQFSDNSTITQAARIIRLVRLIRIMKVYKLAYEKWRREQEEKELLQLASFGIINYQQVQHHKQLNEFRGVSKLGAHLSESITRKVMSLIIIMIIIVPIITFTTIDHSSTFALNFVESFAINPILNDATRTAAFNAIVANTKEDVIPDNFLLRLRINPFQSGYYYANQERSRQIAKIYKNNMTDTFYNSTSQVRYTTSGLFAQVNYAITDAIYSIIFTIIVGIFIIGGALLFTSDAENLILKPIERMMNMVEAVARDPLSPISSTLHSSSMMDEGGGGGGGGGRRPSVRTEVNPLTKLKQKQNATGQYETGLLETTLEKITGLLRVGFGEAGANIISANLSTNNRSATIDPLIPGVRVYAIFGFCDIHQFEDINLKLNRDVLTFVNTIAEIVHSQVHAWGGQCNKNLGNAFVIVWRIGDEESLMAANDASILARKRTNQGFQENRDPHNSSTSYETSKKKWSSAASTYSGESRIKSNTAQSTALTTYSGERSSNQDESLSQDDEDFITVKKKKSHFTVDLRRVPGIDQIADGALIGYLKVIAEINRSSKVLEYRKDPRLNERYAKNQENQKKSNDPGNHQKKGSTTETTLTSNEKAMMNGNKLPKTRGTTSLKGIFDVAPIEEEGEDEQEPELSSAEAEINKMLQFKKQEKEKEEAAMVAAATTSFRKKVEIEQQHKNDFFKVRMGFGLHAGWAIEGAVGSIYKVDATYLSPHVNMAARLETSSRQYKVPLLMSHIFHELLSEIPSKKCRKLDVVTVKGSEIPIGIFTYDCFQDQFFSENSSSSIPLTAHTLHRLISVSGMMGPGKSRLDKMKSISGLIDGFRPRSATPDGMKQRSSGTLDGLKSVRPSTPDLTHKVRVSTPDIISVRNTPPSDQSAKQSTSEFPTRRSGLHVAFSTTGDSDNNNNHDNNKEIEMIQSITPSFHNYNGRTSPALSRNSKVTPTFNDRELPLPPPSNRLKSVTIIESKEEDEEELVLNPHKELTITSTPPTFPNPDDENIALKPIETPKTELAIIPQITDARPSSARSDKHSPLRSSLVALNEFATNALSTTPPPPVTASIEEGGKLPKKPLLLPMNSENSASTRLHLSQVHKELYRRMTKSKSTNTITTPTASNPPAPPSTKSNDEGGQEKKRSLPFLPMNSQQSAKTRLLLSQVHKELVRKKPNENPTTSSRGSIASNGRSPRAMHRSSTGSGASGYTPPASARLPLPPLSTQHSPTARLLLGQVHRELMKIQKEVDRRQSEAAHLQQKRQTMLSKKKKSVTIEGYQGIGEEYVDGDADDIDSEEEEERDYYAVEERLKELFPESEIIVPPYDDHAEIFLKDTDLLQLRCHLNDRFQELFALGVNAYLKGDWPEAKVLLEDANLIMEECVTHFMKTPLYRKTPGEKIRSETVLQVVNYHRLSARTSVASLGGGMAVAAAAAIHGGGGGDAPTKPKRRSSLRKSFKLIHDQQFKSHDLVYGDGPAQTLLNYMKKYDYVAPADWQGYRPLTSK